MGGILGLGHVGFGNRVTSSATSAGTDPQLQFFENFPGKNGANFAAVSMATLSFQAVNIPLSLSFNYPVIFAFVSSNANTTAKSFSASFFFSSNSR